MELRHCIIRSNAATRIQASTHPHQARSGICTLLYRLCRDLECSGCALAFPSPTPLASRLLDFDWLVLWHISLPAWIVAGVNLAFYAGLLWGGVLLYRIALGKERVLVVGWAAVIFLGLIQFLISASAATAIDPLIAFMAAAALLAAVDLFLKMPASGYPRVDNQTSRNT